MKWTISTFCALSLIGAAEQSAAQSTDADAVPKVTIMDPSTVLPSDLETLTKWYSTAIVARVEGLEGVTTAAVGQPAEPGRKGPVAAFIGYRVRVGEVLYDRQGIRASLQPNSVIRVDDMVGIGGLRRFESGDVPLAPGDECLLVITYRPDGRWLLASWANQFRKAPPIEGRVKARSIRPGFEQALRGSGAMSKGADAVETIDWERLIDAFREAHARARQQG